MQLQRAPDAHLTMTTTPSPARAKLNQSLASLAVFLVNITSGMGVGWSSPVWSKLTEPGGGPFLADADEVSWVVAIYDVGIPVGSVVAGLLLGPLGRRRTVALAPVLVLSSALLTYLARSAAALHVARVLLGVSFGLDLSCSSLYIGELAAGDMRGKLCTFTTSLVFVGVLLEYAVGPYVTYWTQALLVVPPALLSLLCLALFTPESPYFLAARGRTDDLYRALARLRAARGVADVEKEAVALLQAAEEHRQQREEQKRQQRLRRAAAPGWRRLCGPWQAGWSCSRGERRGCLIVLFLCGTGPMIGTGSLLSYAQYLFRSTGSALSAEMSAIVMCSVQVVAGLASSQVIDRAGRRRLMLGSACCNAVAMAAAGSFFFVRDVLRQDASSASWLPLASLMVFMVSTNLGTTTVPWVMIGEMVPQRAKAVVPSLAVFGFSVVALVTNKLLPVLSERVGLFLPFWTFGCWSLLVALFTFLLVPETRGKSLLEVQAVLEGERGQRPPPRHQQQELEMW